MTPLPRTESGAALTVGQLVYWHYETRRGWGANWWVPATIQKLGSKRIQIAAELKSGGVKLVWVRADKLKVRNAR